MTAAIDQLEGLWTAQEACEYFNVTNGYIHKLCRKHNLGTKPACGRLLTPADMQELHRLLVPRPDFAKSS